MKVLKFGGSSLATGDRIKNVANIIWQSTTKKKNPIVIVSAFGGITDTLISCGNKASSGDEGYLTIQDEIINRTLSIAKELFPKKEGYNTFINKLNPIIDEFKGLLKGIFLLKEMSDRSLALLLSFGERISALTLASYLTNSGQTSSFVDARGLIITDHHHLKAQVDFMATNHLITEFFKKHKETTIITGFIGATADGVTTTLGRGGSDFSAAILGQAIDADEVWIWTDVDGVMSADPRIVPDAVSIPTLTFREVSELAYYGAKVLHPKTMRPCVENGIPLRIKNTFNPTHPGTVIVDEAPERNGALKAVTAIKGVSMITVEGKGMIGVPGIAARTFGAVARLDVSVLLITQASSEQSICFIVPEASAAAVVAGLEAEFAEELKRRDIERVWQRDEIAIVTIVGAGIQTTPGIAGRVFSALGEHRVNVIAIAQGSSECGISVVVAAGDIGRAVSHIHELIVGKS